MLRRSIFELSSRRSLKRIPRQITAQRFISSRKEFSTASQGNARPIPSSMGKPPDSKGNSSRVLLGSAVVAGAFLVAYQTGYMDQYLGKSQQTSVDSDKIGIDGKDTKDVHNLPEQIVSPNIVHPNSEEPDKSSATKEDKVETQTDLPHSEAFNETLSESHHTVEDKSHVEDGRLPSPKPNLEYQESSVASSAQSTDSGTSSERSAEIGNLKSETSAEPTKEVVTNSLATTVSEENQMKSIPSQHVTTEETPEDAADKAIERSTSLLDAYHLREDAGESSMTSLYREQASKETEALLNAIDDLNAGHISKNGKLVLDFLEAIHVAEKRQAELDAHVFSEERRALKERYENELRDLRARELMRIEEAAILDKELKRERTKAAAAIKSIQEKMDEKLRTELEQKEIEAELKLKKVQELAKAELAAAIATEKAAQIEKMAEANLHINALCMAFYARSEEARKSHFVHKLALGALALEDALSKGLPIQKEIDALQTYLEGIEKDSILDLVLSSLPEESRCCGTDTLLQLSQNFNILKGTLRHFSLIPPGGGGILAHFLAHIATWLKVKEVDQSGEGIESIIKRVDGYLAEGKLAEAAAALEEGVRGSQAEEIVGHWVRRARNRAITEQALTLLESYATCISLT